MSEIRAVFEPGTWENFSKQHAALRQAIVLGQGHLERLLREFIEEYYHVARPH